MNPIQNPNSKFQNHTLYPVIMAVPETVKELTPKERVKFLSRQARRALEISAEKSKVRLGKLEQDERNAPLPFDRIYWSITHKAEYVGGVIAPYPIGIDIEKICSRTEALFQKTATETEWSLADKTFETFFRYWTAKEAVLKAAGIGLKALSKCRIIRVPDKRHLDIEYDANTYRIQHHYYNDHIASIVKNSFEIDWTIV
ncbi:MAG: 4'-phosphopantetheinyl transferase superfamily protein [Deltaproteobacteria bacterium]|jgi:4'-phosphopantetheinyl transferase|nr:4'-phosphopantetheinyl transferase superfamily protein [Deltaproteobacteria bacterium]